VVRPTHDSRALAEFQNGEVRLVYARRKGAPPTEPLYFLKDGTARDPSVRAWVRRHLECFMPECDNRRLTVVNRSEHSGRRDGFCHSSGAGRHSAEGLFHQQGKALIRQWIHDRYPQVEVMVEKSTITRARIADVMVRWPDGRLTAIEIQYAPLTVETWIERHQSYEQQGIKDIWLLGHHGAHLHPTPTLERLGDVVDGACVEGVRPQASPH
jgi:hypothetical protein